MRRMTKWRLLSPSAQLTVDPASGARGIVRDTCADAAYRFHWSVIPSEESLPIAAGRTGGVPGQMGPLGPDLNLVKDWKLAEFIATMRTGIDPNGHELSEQMPWRPIGRMDDDELAAVYEFLTHLPDS